MRGSFHDDVDDIGRWVYSDEKPAKDEFASSSGEGMHGQLDHEIAKGFSVFHRKCFPVKTQCQRITKNTLNITHQSLAIFTWAVHTSTKKTERFGLGGSTTG